jgi:hypothetical protein
MAATGIVMMNQVPCHREGHRQLVGNELGRGADAAEEGVLRVGGPAGEDERIDAQRADGEHREDTDVEVGQHQRNKVAGGVKVGAERHDRDCRQGGNHPDHRGEQEVELVHVARQRVLLEEHLGAVGHEVEHADLLQEADPRHPGQPGRERAVRARAALDPRGDLALDQRAGPADREHDADHREALDQALDERMETGPEIEDGGHARTGW